MKLSDVVRRIYSKVIKLSFVEVLDSSGWQKVDSVNISPKCERIKVSGGNYSLVCTPDHILIDEHGEECFARDSLDKKIKTSDGVVTISKIEDWADGITYDLSLGDNTSHTFYANGILSHNCVICDEFSFVPNNIASKVFESIYPVISSSKNSQFIIVSTPNGADENNLYYSIWKKANSKEVDKNTEGWKAFRFDWWDVPGRDEQWKKNTIASIGQRRFDQEFGNSFLASTDTKKLIADDIIEKYRIKLSEYKVRGITPKKQKIVSQDEKELFEFDMWHEFQPSRTYAASMDISEGVGIDASVLYIWDVTDLGNITLCAKFSCNTVSLVQFAYVARKMLALYNDPPLAAERNGVSAGTLDSLRITYGYKNIIVENKKGEAGIYSHVSVKEKACLWCKEMIETRGFDFTIYDKELLDEFGIFCRKDTKGSHIIYQAIPGPDSHDDHVMAFIWLTFILHNDRIENNFVVCQTFNTDLGKIFPKTLQPLNAYTGEQWRKIQDDPLYKDFLEYKEEGMKKFQSLKGAEELENQRDIFKYSQGGSDLYFGDDDGPSWNSSGGTSGQWSPYNGQSQRPPSLNPNAPGPSFFIV